MEPRAEEECRPIENDGRHNVLYTKVEGRGEGSPRPLVLTAVTALHRLAVIVSSFPSG